MSLLKKSESDIVIIEDADMSQEEFSKELTVVLFTVNKYENDIDLLITLLANLGIGMGDDRNRVMTIDAIQRLFAESGVLASSIMRANGFVLKSVADVLTSRMIEPTMQLRLLIEELQGKSNDNKLDKCLVLLDNVIHFMNFRLIASDLGEGATFINTDDGSIN
jgi:hypothetical protein